MEFFGIIILVLMGCHLANVLVYNPVLRFTMKHQLLGTSFQVSVIILTTTFLLQCLLIILVYYLFSLEVAFLIASLIVSQLGLSAYFILQRFMEKIDKPMFLIKNPSALSKYVFISILFLGMALVINFGWMSLPGILIVWLIYGFSCAEISIRTLMRKSNLDRKDATRRINWAMGVNDMMFGKIDKYPFP